MRHLRFTFALLALCAIFSATSILSAHAQEPIRLGAVLSVTGPASPLGEPEKNTLVMLQDEINKAGGVLGRKIEIIVMDDESDVSKAVLAAEKLLKKEQVAAVMGATTSGSTLAIMGKFPASSVPLVSFAAAEKITKPVNPWIFKVTSSDRHVAQRLLAHAKAKGYKKAALLTVSDGFGQAGREVLKEEIPAAGLEIVADEVFGPKDTDMTAQLVKIKGVAPDFIICWGTNPGPAVVAKNRQQLGMTIPTYMSHGVASKKFIELAGDSAEGLTLPAGRLIVADQLPDNHPQKKILTGYAKDYQARFGAAPSTFGGHAWDGLKLIVKAIEMGKSDKPQDIRDNLEKIAGFVGVGGVFTFTPEDHNGLDASALEMIVIEKGDWKILK